LCIGYNLGFSSTLIGYLTFSSTKIGFLSSFSPNPTEDGYLTAGSVG